MKRALLFLALAACQPARQSPPPPVIVIIQSDGPVKVQSVTVSGDQEEGNNAAEAVAGAAAGAIAGGAID